MYNNMFLQGIDLQDEKKNECTFLIESRCQQWSSIVISIFFFDEKMSA